MNRTQVALINIYELSHAAIMLCHVTIETLVKGLMKFPAVVTIKKFPWSHAQKNEKFKKNPNSPDVLCASQNYFLAKLDF